MKIHNQKGFTLIELVLVIVVLGILAIAALPSFIDVSADAAQSAMDGVVASVREGISLQRANDLVAFGPPGDYPTALDAISGAATCSVATPCFGNVLEQGVTDGSWTRVDGAAQGDYTYLNGTVTGTYTYTSAAGTFQ